MRIAWESLFASRESAARSAHALLRRERHQRGRTGPRPARLRCRVQALRQGDESRSDQRGRVLRESRGGPRSAESRTGGDSGAVQEGHRLGDRKSTRLNSSHSQISYAVFCLKKKKKMKKRPYEDKTKRCNGSIY